MVAMLSAAYLPRTVAEYSIICKCHHTALAFPLVQATQSLTLRRCSLSPDESDVVQTIFVLKGFEQYDYVLMLLYNPGIFHNAKPTISATPLTLIYRT
jgi:hypothetical protein